MEGKWYVVQVLAGHEKKVKKAIEETPASATGVSDHIFEVLVPTENVAEVKKGEQKVQEKIVWPGYALVRADLDDSVWHFIKDVNGVVDFLGGGSPTPLTQAEVDGILDDLRSKKDEVVHKYDIQLGDVVKITEGVFVNITGTVTDIFQEKGKLSVLVSIFGRETRVDDLEFWQVEKVTSD